MLPPLPTICRRDVRANGYWNGKTESSLIYCLSGAGGDGWTGTCIWIKFVVFKTEVFTFSISLAFYTLPPRNLIAIINMLLIFCKSKTKLMFSPPKLCKLQITKFNNFKTFSAKVIADIDFFIKLGNFIPQGGRRELPA